MEPNRIPSTVPAASDPFLGLMLRPIIAHSPNEDDPKHSALFFPSAKYTLALSLGLCLPIPNLQVREIQVRSLAENPIKPPYRVMQFEDADLEALLARVAAGELAVAETARRLAFETPTLAELAARAPEEFQKLAHAAMGQRLARELDRTADLAGIDYAVERVAFLDQAGRAGSAHARKAHRRAFERLDAFAGRRGIEVLAMQSRDADDFCHELARKGRAAASVRLDLSACSSFFSYLSRLHETLRNPLRGTKARPAARPPIPPRPREG